MWSQRKEFCCDPLRQRVLEDLQIRYYCPTTIRLYLYAVREFAKHFGKPPDQLGAEHIRRYPLFLTKEKKVSTSTYVLMVCALRFFYSPPQPVAEAELAQLLAENGFGAPNEGTCRNLLDRNKYEGSGIPGAREVATFLVRNRVRSSWKTELGSNNFEFKWALSSSRSART
jgi:hypothetical protein